MMKTEALWERFSVPLRGWLRRQTRDPELAEELLQETFLKVHTALPELRDQERMAPWLYRIARSTLFDHHRRARPASPLLEEPPAPEPEDTAVDQLVAGWLSEIRDTLSERDQEPLRLVELEGLSQTEAANRLGLSASGARSRVQRGRQQLKARLLDCCEILREGGAVLDWKPRPGGCSCE
ncbi:MAG: RNA polymerase sigma-70 factor (ECF subfamily) [Myxococcota bacterium]|jgi:RNA polymerase sigma-70 factor (ECF subfamily)